MLLLVSGELPAEMVMAVVAVGVGQGQAKSRMAVAATGVHWGTVVRWKHRCVHCGVMWCCGSFVGLARTAYVHRI